MQNGKTLEEAEESLRTHAREVREASQDLARSTRATLDDARLAGRLQLERSPYLTLGVAFGIGYVLGGGLPVGAMRFAIGAGLRIATSMALRELVSRASGGENRHQRRRSSPPPTWHEDVPARASR